MPTRAVRLSLALGAGIGRGVRMLLPALCPVCRSVPRPVGGCACSACLGDLGTLPGPRCGQCGGTLDGALEACGECLRLGPRPWTLAVSAFRFDGVARQVIHRFKYQGDTALARPLAAAMAANWRLHGSGQPDVVTAVPLHWSKRAARGYNQAELLAELVSRELCLPLEALLRRCRRTAQQAMLDFDERQQNMRGVFAVRSSARLGGRRVLLVDDVLTTGATLAEASRTLLAADAAAVSILTAARG